MLPGPAGAGTALGDEATDSTSAQGSCDQETFYPLASFLVSM